MAVTILGRYAIRPAPLRSRRLRRQRRRRRHDRRAAAPAGAGVATATNLLLHMVTDEEVAGPAPIAAWSEAGRMRSSSASRAHSTSGLPNPGWSTTRRGRRHRHPRPQPLARPPGHAGQRSGGVNAIDKAFVVAQAVRDLEREWTRERHYPLLPDGFNTINLGAIVGGKSGGMGRSTLRQDRAVSPTAARSSTTSGTTRTNASPMSAPSSRRASSPPVPATGGWRHTRLVSSGPCAG